MKILPLILSFGVIAFLIVSILLFPKIRIGKIEFQSFWFVAMVGAIVLVLCGCVSFSDLKDSFLSSSSVNPVKILVLFVSLSSLSIFLDELGFFSWLAAFFARHFSKNQYILFFGFYFAISLLTVFTSNDIIILTFTPFLCHLCKKSKINPLPYLMMEFVAANTWSSLLIIGNPTNIYLASFFHLSFLQYFLNMLLPTTMTSLVGLLLLFLLFRKDLKAPIDFAGEEQVKMEKLPLIVGLIHLIGCTILLSLSSYFDFPMWIIAFCFAFSLTLFVSIYSIAKKKDEVLPLLKRLPWNLVPFVLSMFVVVLALKNSGFIEKTASVLLSWNPVFSFGYSGLAIANLINNIPMAVFFSSLLTSAPVSAVYSSILASNVAAYLTPMGALAGIMFLSLTEKQGIRISFFTFIKYGAVIGILSATAGFATIWLLPI